MRIAVAAVVGALALTTAGCGGFGDASSGSDSDATLTMYAAEGGSSRAFMRAAEDFEAQTGVTVNIQVFAYQDLRDKQILELSNGAGGVDVVAIDGPIWLEELKQYLLPVEDYVSEDDVDLDAYVPTYLDMVRSDDTLYGLPIRIAPWPLIYRTDLLEELGAEVPRTFEELRDIGLQLKEREGVYGLSLSLKQTNYLVASWLPFLYGFGGNILNDDWTRADFNTDAGRESLQFLVDLYRTDQVIPQSAIDAEMDGVVTTMQQGDAAMAFTYAPYFLDIDNPEMTDFSGNFDVAAVTPYAEGSGLDAGVCEISGWSFGINANSANADLAWDFVQFAASPDEQRVLALEANNTPTVESIFHDPDFQEIYPASENILEAALNGRQRPGVASWNQIEDALIGELSAAVNGIKPPDDALADAEAEVNDILGR